METQVSKTEAAVPQVETLMNRWEDIISKVKAQVRQVRLTSAR